MTAKAIDLFAGASGFTLAALNAGVDVLAAIEFDKAAYLQRKLHKGTKAKY